MTKDEHWQQMVQKHTEGGACNFRNAAFEFAQSDRIALEAAHVLISRLLHSYMNIDIQVASAKTGELIRAQAAGASDEVLNQILKE